MTVYQARLFLAVASAQSLSHAAAMLSMSQPALSQHIARLERQYGVRLLERTGRGVRLTEEGRRMRSYAADVLESHDSLVRDLSEIGANVRGVARIGMIESVARALFLPLIRSTKARFPEATFRLVQAPGVTMVEQLAARRLDIAVAALDVSSSAVVAEPMALEHLHLIGPVGDAIVAAPDIPLAGLGSLPLILTSPEGGFSAIAEPAFAEAGIRPDIRFEVDHNQATVDLVREGMGYAMLPYCAVAMDVERGFVAAARIVEPTLDRVLAVVLPAAGALSPVVNAGLGCLRDVIRAEAERVRWTLTGPRGAPAPPP